MSDATVVRQKVLSFSSEGHFNSLGEAIQQVTNQLNERLSGMRNPVVVSLSHNSGHADYTRYYASIVVVISL